MNLIHEQFFLSIIHEQSINNSDEKQVEVLVAVKKKR